MNRSLLITLLACAAAAGAARAAGESFSKSIPAADYAAAGLNKLTPAELERLDALVRTHRSGSARVGVTEAVPAAGTRRMPSPEKPGKIVVEPGTEVEFQAVQSRIAGEFRGWEPRMVFVLENGQRWQVMGGSRYHSSARLPSPAVRIEPGMLGAWWMSIENVSQRVKVAPLHKGD